MNRQPQLKKEWPKYAVGPSGNRAIFDGRGDVPIGWVIEGEAPDPAPPAHPPAAAPSQPMADDPTVALAAARADYKTKFGKAPFHKWDVAKLREKIAHEPAAS